MKKKNILIFIAGITTLVAVILVAMILIGPFVGNVFSTINSCLGTCPPTSISTSPIISVPDQLAEIDAALRQSVQASIAYNAPATAQLNESFNLELLLNPSLSEPQLGNQVTENGAVVTSTIEITPQMKAVITPSDPSAFIIQPLHDSPEQLIGGTETTKWHWLVTAKKEGEQKLVLVVYRLIKIDSQESWREVETHKANIKVTVSMAQRFASIDWKWIVGLVISLMLIPAFWRWIDSQKKERGFKLSAGPEINPAAKVTPSRTSADALQYEKAVFVSYAWEDESERTVDELELAFANHGIRIVRDKKDLGYKGSIETFEQRIGQGQCIVLVISDKYLRSEHCMFELVEVDKNRGLRERIFPIVLADARIYKPTDRLTYIKHWDEQIEQLNQAIKQVDVMTNLSGFTADLDKYARIRANFDHLTDLLSDMNALTPERLAARGFSTLISAVENVVLGPNR